MKCKKCKQEGSPIYRIVEKLSSIESVSVLSSCAGFLYDEHHNIPDLPFILFHISSSRMLENLWQKVFSRLSVPTRIVYNGCRQYIFEIDLPQNWPKRDEVLSEIWKAIAYRMEKF